MKKLFLNTPKCELCGEKEATYFSASVLEGKYVNWKFVCSECEVVNEYYIGIDKFFASPESTLQWLDHMYRKNGMEWDSFMDMIHRFRQRTRGDDGSLEDRIKEKFTQ